MNKVIEKILTDTKTRQPEQIKSMAFSQSEFTPWEGDE